MNDDWILEVLADLKFFAEQNGLPFLAGNLEDTQRLAAIELASRLPEPGVRTGQHLLRYYLRRGRGNSGGFDS